MSSLVEVCKCNGWELWRSKDPAKPVAEGGRELIPSGSERSDEDGYLLCPFCWKLEVTYLGQLAQCDVCDGYFKGYKKYPSIRYTCDDCEAKL